MKKEIIIKICDEYEETVIIGTIEFFFLVLSMGGSPFFV
jgi:hypothetical protein